MLAWPPGAFADGLTPPQQGVWVGVSSQQFGSTRAAVVTDIGARERHRDGYARDEQPGQFAVEPTATSAPPEPQPTYPTLTSDSPLFQNPAPFGPASFWYPDGSGHSCIYAPDSSPACFAVVGGRPPGGWVNPVVIAAAVSDRLDLMPGQIRASPSTNGVTGAASWFWLEPPPRERVLSTSLAGETVTVDAVPSVGWEFGDGSGSDAGAGVSYRPGAPPPEAVTHEYQTRCLPGDRGRDPYVLGSCGSDGYRVVALVSWQISYRAAGPVAASGTLPTRTTETSTAYPVSEVRGFLVGGAP
jgi:hypothetical protein